jgi:hypothetical protein
MSRSSQNRMCRRPMYSCSSDGRDGCQRCPVSSWSARARKSSRWASSWQMKRTNGGLVRSPKRRTPFLESPGAERKPGRGRGGGLLRSRAKPIERNRWNETQGEKHRLEEVFEIASTVTVLRDGAITACLVGRKAPSVRWTSTFGGASLSTRPVLRPSGHASDTGRPDEEGLFAAPAAVLPGFVTSATRAQRSAPRASRHVG